MSFLQQHCKIGEDYNPHVADGEVEAERVWLT